MAKFAAIFGSFSKRYHSYSKLFRAPYWETRRASQANHSLSYSLLCFLVIKYFGEAVTATTGGNCALPLNYAHWRRQGGAGGPAPPQWPTNLQLLEPVVLNLSFQVRSNAYCLHLKDDISVTDILKISKITWNYLHFSTKLVKILKLLQSPVHLMTHKK